MWVIAMIVSADEFKESVQTLLDYITGELKEIEAKYGKDNNRYLAYKSLYHILSKYLKHSADFTNTDDYTVLPSDKRTVTLPDDTTLAYVVTRRVDDGVNWYRIRGVAPGTHISGMYAKATDARVLGNAAIDAVLSDYITNKKCKTCPIRDDCRTIALFEFARGIVAAMEDNGYDPSTFYHIFLAAHVFRILENYFGAVDANR